jgi:hypothetical protein
MKSSDARPEGRCNQGPSISKSTPGAKRVGLAMLVAVTAASSSNFGLLAGAIPAATTHAAADVQTKKILVLLCKFQDHPEENRPASYYRELFSTAGETRRGLFDYWKEVSYGNLILDVKVTEWITVQMNQHVFTRTGEDGENPDDCARYAMPPIDPAEYQSYKDATQGGIIVIPNMPKVGNPGKLKPYLTTLSQPVNADDTIIHVDPWDPSTNPFPAPPFTAFLGATPGVDDNGAPNENGVYRDQVTVTAVDGTTWTVERTAGKTEHAVGELVAFINVPRFQGKPGLAYLSDDVDVWKANQEVIHLLGFDHSRALSGGPIGNNDYTDPFDAASGGWSSQGAYGGGLGSPWMNAANLDLTNPYKSQSWFTGAVDGRKEPFDNTSCRAQTFTLAALNHPEVPGPLTVVFPAAVPIGQDENGTSWTSTQYYVEFRHKTGPGAAVPGGWDGGIPDHMVLLHVDGGGDNHSYLVDAAGDQGALTAGSTYADADRSFYIGVNRIDSGAMTATVTIGSCLVPTVASLSGDSTGDFGDTVTLAADLTVSGSGAPIPNADVTLTLGNQSCPAGTKTDGVGHASCVVTLNQQPGPYTLQITYAGDAAYQTAGAAQSFIINRAAVTATLSGGTSGDYGDPITLAADLTVSDTGAPIPNVEVSLTLGSQSCPSGTRTNGAGHASCTITLNQQPGSYTTQVSFAGDAYYRPASASAAFTINREQTSLVISGGTFIATGDPVSAVLKEADGAALAGKTVVLTIAGTQSCTGTTDATGTATCTIAKVNHPLGPATLSAAFAGDAFYLGTSTQRSVTSFAWTAGGNFVIGDGNSAAGTTATFWADEWYLRNSVSGGIAPNAFKGFANSPPGATPCGGTWNSSGGNSPPPSGTVPEYTAMLVTSQITKSGTTIAGTKPRIVVVRVNPGYAPKPGRSGTATVLGFYC